MAPPRRSYTGWEICRHIYTCRTFRTMEQRTEATKNDGTSRSISNHDRSTTVCPFSHSIPVFFINFRILLTCFNSTDNGKHTPLRTPCALLNFALYAGPSPPVLVHQPSPSNSPPLSHPRNQKDNTSTPSTRIPTLSLITYAPSLSNHKEEEDSCI